LGRIAFLDREWSPAEGSVLAGTSTGQLLFTEGRNIVGEGVLAVSILVGSSSRKR
jgi:hypothetical protein